MHLCSLVAPVILIDEVFAFFDVECSENVFIVDEVEEAEIAITR